MTDARGPVYDPDDSLAGLEGEEERLEHTRVDYSGIDPNSEFQPVDEVELAEEGMLLDDPERLSRGDDRDPDNDEALDPDEVGWNLDES